MNRITSSWISEAGAQDVCRILTDAGFLVFFVGGCVRNELLNVPISDLDLATNARPQVVVDLATKAGLKAIPTGIEHGTITIIAQGQSYEVTTFRKDVETDGRHAVVQFSDSIDDDARRRDFTMNALYADPSGRIFDPLGGMSDLKNRIVRFIENPENRIQEDYLRILRFFRFNAWYGSTSNGIDPDSLAAISANLVGLDTLSSERLGREMLKTLAAPNPAWAVATMQKTGVLARILPGATAEAVSILVHFEQQNDIAPNPLRRLISLGLDLEIKDRLRLSKKEMKYIKTVVSEVGKTTGVAELAYANTAPIAFDIILLRGALAGIPLPDGVEENLRLGAQACFPIGAQDLIKNYQGAELGKKLQSLEARWIASGFDLSREELLA